MILGIGKKLNLLKTKKSFSDISAQVEGRESFLIESFYKDWLKKLSKDEFDFVASEDIDNLYSNQKSREDILADIRSRLELNDCNINRSDKFYSNQLRDILKIECINNIGDVKKELSFFSLNSNALPKQGIPHITHHIWVGNQNENGEFKRPNEVNLSVTLQTLNQFDDSWTHYFWTNDIRSLPDEIVHNPKIQIKILGEEDLALKDKIEILSKNQHFAVAAGDITRLSVLNKFGGLYLDMDYKVVKSLNQLADNYDYVSGYDESDSNIGNAFIMAYPNHPIIQGTLNIIERNLNQETAPIFLKKAAILFSWVIMATGPTALTTSFYKNSHQNGNKDLNLDVGKIFNMMLANKAKNGFIPPIQDPEYYKYLPADAYGNDRFGGTWSNPDFESESYLINNYAKIFGEIYPNFHPNDIV